MVDNMAQTKSIAEKTIDIATIVKKINQAQPYHIRGRVIECTGLVIRALVPGVRIGELCFISSYDSSIDPIKAEVVGFREGSVFLMPLGELNGIGPDSAVHPSGQSFSIRCGYSLLGRVLNGCGEAMDAGSALSELSDLEEWAVDREAPNPYTRQPVDQVISLGVRAIDSLLTVGRGQRVGLFAGSGVGKSVLMGQIARNTSAEIVVVCLVGERGREVLDFIHESLGQEGMKRTVVVAATSNAPSLVRTKSCFVATAIAEWFRDQGHDVLFMMDSATRFARAQREIGLAIGEPPARQGYPPSVFAQIPRLMERTGNNQHGSITAIYTVLVQASDMDEPIADEVRGILDGHFILNRSLGERNHWPAIDVLPSLSRVMNNIVGTDHKQAAQKLRSVLAIYEKNRDLIILGAYKRGSDTRVDYAIEKITHIESFLKQEIFEKTHFDQTIQRLIALFDDRKSMRDIQ